MPGVTWTIKVGSLISIIDQQESLSLQTGSVTMVKYPLTQLKSGKP